MSDPAAAALALEVERRRRQAIEDAKAEVGTYGRAAGELVSQAVTGVAGMAEPVRKFAGSLYRGASALNPLPKGPSRVVEAMRANPDHRFDAALAALRTYDPERHPDWTTPGAGRRAIEGERDPPEGGPEIIARRIGAEFALNLPFAALPLGLAAKGARVAGKAATNIGGHSFNRWMQGIRNNPYRVAMGESAATLGAGVGGGGAEVLAPDSMAANIVGTLAGGIGGGLAPGMVRWTGVGLSVRLYNNLWNQTTGRITRETENAARIAVQRAIGENTAQRTQGIREGQRLRMEIPGYNPSLANVTGSRALIRTQEAFERAATGEKLENIVIRGDESLAAINRYAAENAPGRLGVDTPEYVIDAASGRFTRLGVQMDTSQEALSARRVAAGEPAAGLDPAAIRRGEGIPKADLHTTGAQVRQAFIKAEEKARARATQQYNDAGLGDMNFDINDTQKFIDDVSAEFEGGRFNRNIPAEVNDVLNLDLAEPFTFGHAMELRANISSSIRAAAAGASKNPREYRNLLILRKQLDDFLEDTIHVPAKYVDAYRTFRKDYGENVIDVFENGPVYKVTQRDGRGFYVTSNEDVARLFFNPGNIAEARQFNRVFANNPAMQDAMAVTILDNLRQATVRMSANNPGVQPGLLNTWVRKHGAVLEEFPAIRAMVGDVEELSVALSGRQAQLTARNRAIGEATLARELTSYGAKTGNRRTSAQQIINNSLQNPEDATAIMRYLRGNDEAISAYQRNVWDSVVGGTLNELSDHLENNVQAMVRIFGMKHIQTLRNIFSARTQLSRVQPPRGAGISPDPLQVVEEVVGMPATSLGTRGYAYMSGRLSKSYLQMDILSRYVRGRALKRSMVLFEEALYNPQVADDFLKVHTSSPNAVPPAVGKRLNTWLLNLGRETRDEEQQQRPGWAYTETPL